MVNVRPTVRDLSRAVARLDENASAGEGDVVRIAGENWTGLDLRISVAESLMYVAAKVVKTRRVTKRDVALMLAAHGASAFTVEQHASAIARLVRADQGLASWSAII